MHDPSLKKNINFYFSIRSKEDDSENRVEIVNTNNLQKVTSIDTDEIINGRVYWVLCAKNETVLLAVYDCRNPKDFNCAVNIYRNQMRQCTVPLNTNLSSFPNLGANVMMIESTLLIFCGMGTNIVVPRVEIFHLI